MATIVHARALPLQEPHLDPATLVRRAAEMRPMLRAGQPECEAAGRILDGTNEQFVAAGLYRVLQPRRFGGYEFGLETFLRIAIELARGCPSCGWVYALTAGHTHTAALFPEAGQVDVFGDDGEFRAPMTTSPVPARPIEGGFVLDGHWDYASGCDVATHHIGAFAPVGEDGELQEMHWCIVPRADYTVVDNWDVFGMRGTGSRRVVVSDLFVPERRTVAREPDLELPGRSVHANPVYRAGAVLPLFFGEVAAVAVGVARGVVDVYEELLDRKRESGIHSPLRREVPIYRGHLGHAIALVETAESALMGVAASWTEQAHAAVVDEEPVAEEMTLRLLLVEQQVVRLASDAVDLVFRTSGTSVARAGEPILRSFRDMSIIRTHIGLQFEQAWERVGSLRFAGSDARPDQ